MSKEPRKITIEKQFIADVVKGDEELPARLAPKISYEYKPIYPVKKKEEDIRWVESIIYYKMMTYSYEKMMTYRLPKKQWEKEEKELLTLCVFILFIPFFLSFLYQLGFLHE